MAKLTKEQRLEEIKNLPPIEPLPGEIWKDVLDYEGYLKISNFGRLIRKIYLYETFYEEIVSPTINGNGYYQTSCNRKFLLIHRLVAQHFLEPDLTRVLVNHKDQNKLNNHISNLEWVNRRENSVHHFNRSNRSSNYTGVSWEAKCKRWYARIKYKGKHHHLGAFKTEEEAYEARCKFERENDVTNKYL